MSTEHLPLELLAVAHAYRTDYIPLAADHVVARDEAARIITSEAMLFESVAKGDDANGSTHEIVTWRVDGIVTEGPDDGYDFASRARMTVSNVTRQLGSRALLQSAPLALEDMLRPPLKSDLQKQGFTDGEARLLGMEYRTTPLTTVDPAFLLAPFNMTQLRHGDMIFQAAPKAGSVVTFERLLSYADIISDAYGQLCAKKFSAGAEGASLLIHLGEAAKQDERNRDAPSVNDMQAYTAALESAPHDTKDQIKVLAEALYDFNMREEISPSLATLLMKPGTALAAQIALLNKWSYVRHVARGTYTPPLTAQLQQISTLGAAISREAQTAVCDDHQGFEQLIIGSLEAALNISEKAKAFAAHLSMPATISLQDETWSVRPR